MKQINYSWSQFENDCKAISIELEKHKSFIKDIYGIPRNGLFIAIALSHLLEKPILLDRKKISKSTLVVDDIVDTGKTLRKLLKEFFPYRTVTLFLTKPEPKNVLPDYKCRTKKQGDWIIYPWETKKSTLT